MGRRSNARLKTQPRSEKPAFKDRTTRSLSGVRLALSLALFAALLYSPSWRYGFVGDDSRVILDNQWTKQGVPALPHIMAHSLYFGAVPLNGGLYRPIAGAYYDIVGAVTGLSATGYHLAQLALYALNAALVFLFFARLKRSSMALPLVATLLFIVHPIHTEVVDNIKSADEMLCLAFLLVSAISWLAFADQRDRRFRITAFVAYGAAVCSKETAVAMVVLFPALWYFFRGRSLRDSVSSAVPFVGVAVGYLLLRQVVLSREPATAIVTVLNNALVSTADRWTRLASALGFLTRYAQMLFWPHPLSFDYSYNAVPLRTFADPRAWIALALCSLGIGVFAVRSRGRHEDAFVVLWCFASIVLVSNVFFLISTNFGERLLYVPSVMFCYLMALVLFRVARVPEDRPLREASRSPVLVGVVLLVVVAAVPAVFLRTGQWRDQLTLFEADVHTYPNSARLNAFVGSLYYYAGDKLVADQRDPAAAAGDFVKARTYLLRSLEIQDIFTEIHAVLGMAEYQLQDYRNAIPHLQQALQFTNYHGIASEMLGESYERNGMADGALDVYSHMHEGGLRFPHELFVLGQNAAVHGDLDRSISYFSEMVASSPGDANPNFDLAQMASRKGDYALSLSAAQRCIGIQPNHAGCLALAAEALVRTGHPAEAESYFERAKSLDPRLSRSPDQPSVRR